MESSSDISAEEAVCSLDTNEVIDLIVSFTEELTNISVYAYQSLFCRRIIQSVVEHEGATVTALWARQSGKTEAVSFVVVGLCVLLPVLAKAFPADPRFKPFSRGFLVGVYAPIDRQATLPYQRIRNALGSERAEQILEDEEIGVSVISNNATTTTLSNGSRILCRTASESAATEGDTHHLVICEESQKLSLSKVDKEITPMLASTNGTMVKIGTAWISRGGFHHSIQQNVEEHKRGGRRSHFEFDWKVVVAEKKRAYTRDGNVFHLNYEKFVARKMREMGGEASDEFKMNFMCLWMDNRSIAVKLGVFRDASLKAQEAGPRRTPGMIQVAGLDVAKLTDCSVLTIGYLDVTRPTVERNALFGADVKKLVSYPKYILDWLELQGDFEGDNGQYNTLVRYLSDTSVKILVVDATGMGNPVAERLAVLLGDMILVEPFTYSTQSKAALYSHYLAELHSRRLFYPGGVDTRERFEYRKFVQEHEDLDRVEKGGQIVCEAPDGGHDDYPDSAALFVWGADHALEMGVPEVDVESADDYGLTGRSARSSVGGRAARYKR